MSGDSELAHCVYSKLGVRHNSGVHISRFALWASAWAVVDVEPTQDIKKRNSLSITQPSCSLQKTCQTVQKCKAVSSSIAYFSIYGLLLFGLENKSLLVSKSSGEQASESQALVQEYSTQVQGRDIILIIFEEEQGLMTSILCLVHPPHPPSILNKGSFKAT